jgi:hypothetical protein
MERFKLQEELIAELRQENGVLNEMVKQKDAVIQQLTRDLQSRGTKGDHCNKTESTSRESDDHLRDREMAILRRKNLRLQKLVKKKQTTIVNLMETLQSALGGQTSDGEMLRLEGDADELDSDTALGSTALSGPAGRAAAESDCSESGPEAVREVLANGSLSQVLASRPQTRTLQSPAAQQRAAVAAAPPPVGGMSRRSKAALEALAKETSLLEEKKRLVEQLARSLEPASDNDEEDDGFPLQ